jgi:hypothetical protein
MIPEPVGFRRQALQFRQPLVDHGALVALEVLLAHVVQRLLERVEEVLDATLEILTFFLTLDEDAVT